MNFTVKINNLGRLSGAPIKIGGLTVLAGPNATGKSFLSKALYSIFGAMNANHALEYIQGLTGPLNRNLQWIKSASYDIRFADPLFARLRKMVEICKATGDHEDKFSAINEVHGELIGIAQEAIDAYAELRPEVEKLLDTGRCGLYGKIPLAEMDREIHSFTSFVKSAPNDILFNGFRYALDRNLLGNFQINSPFELKRSVMDDASIDIESVGKISIERDIIHTDVPAAGLTLLQRHSGVIYLESPVHWKLRGALNAAGRPHDPRERKGYAEYLDVPKYFYDLDIEVGRKRAGDVAFPDLLARLTGKNVLGGKVSVDDGALAFVENEGESNRSFSLPLAATGAVNLGILALLIERKIIDKDAFLFIDEPESNLHPSWQVVMIEALLELARGGVNVVIATHSADIVQRLAALAPKHPDGLIAWNHFSRDGVKNEDSDAKKKINGIIKELTDPYSDSYMMSKGMDK